MPTGAFLPYPSELSDREWAILEPLLPPAKPGGRPRSVSLRVILNGIFYLLRSGCQWRMLPRTFGSWSTVYAYFRAWRRSGVWEGIHTTLRERVRQQSGREPTPSAAIRDTSIVNRSRRPNVAVPMATMEARSSPGANATCWSIRLAWSSEYAFIRPMSRIAPVLPGCYSNATPPCHAWS